ncbi:MAG TPA: hypothetical protein VMU27_03425 [Candidatus Paceibacterota bacterium]|nr:hypothetical protein [Candidatus Paceibacterota bacterium]
MSRTLAGGEQSWWLLSRYFLINIIGVLCFAYAWQRGWVQMIYNFDDSHISVAIFVIFVIGNILTGWHTLKIGRELDRLKKTGTCKRLVKYLAAIQHSIRPDDTRREFETRMAVRIRYLTLLHKSLSNAGLVGTFLGIIVAVLAVMAAMKQQSGADMEHLKDLLLPAFEGIGISVTTALSGLVCSMWLSWVVLVLKNGTEMFTQMVIAQGAQKVSPGGMK